MWKEEDKECAQVGTLLGSSKIHLFWSFFLEESFLEEKGSVAIQAGLVLYHLSTGCTAATHQDSLDNTFQNMVSISWKDMQQKHGNTTASK